MLLVELKEEEILITNTISRRIEYVKNRIKCEMLKFHICERFECYLHKRIPTSKCEYE